MADYREMYLRMVRASEEALRILIKAQQECEELYLSGEDPKLIVLPLTEETADGDGESNNAER